MIFSLSLRSLHFALSRYLMCCGYYAGHYFFHFDISLCRVVSFIIFFADWYFDAFFRRLLFLSFFFVADAPTFSIIFADWGAYVSPFLLLMLSLLDYYYHFLLSITLFFAIFWCGCRSCFRHTLSIGLSSRLCFDSFSFIFADFSHWLISIIFAIFFDDFIWFPSRFLSHFEAFHFLLSLMLISSLW